MVVIEPDDLSVEVNGNGDDEACCRGAMVGVGGPGGRQPGAVVEQYLVLSGRGEALDGGEGVRWEKSGGLLDEEGARPPWRGRGRQRSREQLGRARRWC